MISFRHPTTILIAGPTQARKTFFFKQILENQLIQPEPSRIIFVYGEQIPDFASLHHRIEFVKGMKRFIEDVLPTIESSERNLVAIDDQMSEAGKLDEMANLFTKGSDHKNITVVYIVQNVFDKGKAHRTISLNSHYIVLFKNPRDQGQIRSLAQQVFPSQVKFLMDAFKEATRSNHGYLLLDLHPQTPDQLRVRSRLFKNDNIEIYASKTDAQEQSFELSPQGYINCCNS